MHPTIHEPRRFFASSTCPLSQCGGWSIAAAVMLMLFSTTFSAHGQTTVTGGSTTTLANPAAIGTNLDFVAGTGDPAVLELLLGGTYTGEWSITDVSATFSLNGGSLLIEPTVGAGTASGSANLSAQNGTLQLGANSFLTGFGTGGTGGTLSATNGGHLVIDDKQWITSVILLQLGGSWTSGSAATLTYSGADSVSSAADFALSFGGASAIALSGAGSLTLTGDIQGTGDLVVTSGGGTGTANLSFGSGFFVGKTIIDGTSASINTQNSIGVQGLTLNNGAVTVGTALTLATGQAFSVNGASSLTGSGPGRTAFTVNSLMSGTITDSLALNGIDLNVGGTTSSFTGALTLAGAVGSESTVTTTNAAWLGGVSSLTMGNNTSLTYAGTDAATYAGALVVGGAAGEQATVATSGVGTGDLTLTGALSGDGNLLVTSVSGSTAKTTLAFTSGALTGQTILDNAIVGIDTQASIGAAGLSFNNATVTTGTALTLSVGQAFAVNGTSSLTGSALGLTAFTANEAMSGTGSLTLSGINLNVGGTTSTFTGALTLAGATGSESTVTTSNAAWLGGVNSLTMGSNTSLTYVGADTATYAGALVVGGAAGEQVTIATSGAGTGDLTLTGALSGAGNLLVTSTGGSTAKTRLAFTSGALTGKTIIDGAIAGIDTQASIGDAGLSFNNATVTAGTALTLGAGQAFAVNGTSSLTGVSPGLTAFTVNDAMSGTGTFALQGIELNVGATTSTFTGGVSLGTGSSVSTSSAAWLGGVSSLSLNIDGTATAFTYTGTTSASYAGALVSGGTAASTIATSGVGAGSLAFTGALSGSGDLVFAALSGSTATTTLAFTSSTFTGTTVIDGTAAAINTQNSVGGAGLKIIGSQVDVGDNLSLSATQSLTIGGITTLTGTFNPLGLTELSLDGGLNVNGGSANLKLSKLQTTVSAGAASNFAGDVTLTSGSVFALTNGADLSGASVFSDALNTGGAVTVGGDGTLANIGSIGNAFKGLLTPGNRDGSGSSKLTVAGDVMLDSTSTTRWYLLDSTGKADQLNAAGTFGLNNSAAKIFYDQAFYSGAFIPASGTTVNYLMATAGNLSGTFSTVDVVTVDPLTHLATAHAVNATGSTYFMGGAFEVSYAGNEFSLAITGQGSSYPLPAGTTSTNVVVDVQTGSGTMKRNANVGTVNNSQINASAAAITAIATGPSDPDEQYVATQMLLLTPGPFASAEVALSNVSNPYALPNVTMSQFFQAGDVAMKRLMQLREGATPSTVTPLLSSKGGVTDQDSLKGDAGSAVVTGNSFTSFGAPLNGPTPDEGARWWSRGYGFTDTVSDDSWAKTSYSSATGGLMFGADMVLGKGLIVGAFIGYMPGSIDINGGLVDETDTVNGMNVGVYGSWVPDSGLWYVEAAAQGGYAGVDRSRQLYIPGVVRTANSDNSLWAASINSEIGMNVRIGGDTFFQPYATLAAGYVGQGAYNENGAGSANLDVSSQDAIMLQPKVGARMMHTLRIDHDVLTPYFGSAFIANVPIGDWDVTATNAYSATPGYSVYGSPDTRYGVSFEAGVEFASYKGVTAYCSFNGLQFENEQQYGGQIGVIVPF